MALFEVNRYLGDDDSVNERPEASNILDQLKQQAKARKKKHGRELEVKDSEITVEDDQDVKECDEPVAGEKVETSVEEEHSTKKKKKKRKYKLSEIGEGEDNVNELESDAKKSRIEGADSVDDDESVRLKKSKKHKKHKKTKAVDKTVDENESSVVENIDDDMNEVLDNDNDDVNDKDVTVDTDDKDKEDLTSKSEIGGFTVIGEVQKNKPTKVQRVLPDWLSKPNIITADLTIDKLPVTDMPGLADDLVEKLQENGITYFFPVQKQVIPALLESSLTGFLTGRAGYRPCDICVSAPTGSGKTLAFVLPIVQALRTRVTCEVRALAVLPVKDLAAQVYKVFQTYCKGTNLKVGLLTGQKPFTAEQHTLVRKRLVGYHSMYDIIVATPGRLVDHINQTDGFNLSHLRYLVIDEADRVMDEVKQDWLLQVETAVYKYRSKPGHLAVSSCINMEMPLQKLLYSATLSQNPEKLQQLNLFQPKLFTSVVKAQNRSVIKQASKTKSISETNAAKSDADSGVVTHDSDHEEDKKEDTESMETEETKPTKSGDYVGKYATPTSLSEYVIETTSSQKPLILLHLLHHLKFRNIICFTNSVDTTHRLFLLIKLFGDIKVKELSSSVHVKTRNDMIKKFMSGKIDILICSDAMARGMDIENVNYVVSYDPPAYIQTYIHRIGRTARAGKQGSAFTLLEDKEFFHFKKMVKDAGKGRIEHMKIDSVDLEPFIPKYEDVLKQLGELLKYDKTKKRHTDKKQRETKPNT
ncbi:ATP-dependent RNA helicase ddx51 [Mactra antiquata]